MPRMGITGAAIASLIGYSVLLAVSLIALVYRRELGLWQYLRPQSRDIPLARLKSLANSSLLGARGTEG